jgi:hypothetical protein
MVEVPRKVGGPGDCWKKLPFTKDVDVEHATVDDVIKAWKRDGKRALPYGSGYHSGIASSVPRLTMWVRWNFDQDEDYHVEEVFTVPGKADCNKVTAQVRKMISLLQPLKEGEKWDHILDFIALMEDQPTKFVGDKKGVLTNAV